MEFVFTILGMCLTVVPFVMIANYFFTRVTKKTKFDCHVRSVEDKKGSFGIVIAYLTKVSFLLCIFFFGILCVCQFENVFVFKFFIIDLVVFFVLCFFDNNNEK